MEAVAVEDGVELPAPPPPPLGVRVKEALPVELDPGEGVDFPPVGVGAREGEGREDPEGVGERDGGRVAEGVREGVEDLLRVALEVREGEVVREEMREGERGGV